MKEIVNENLSDSAVEEDTPDGHSNKAQKTRNIVEEGFEDLGSVEIFERSLITLNYITSNNFFDILLGTTNVNLTSETDSKVFYWRINKNIL